MVQVRFHYLDLMLHLIEYLHDPAIMDVPRSVILNQVPADDGSAAVENRLLTG